MTTITDYDFAQYLDYNRRDLLKELAATHQELAILYEEIAFTKIAEADNPQLKLQRFNDEGHRDALKEKKALLVRLLDNVATDD